MSYEKDVLHPAVAIWLTKNGYTYRQEVILIGVGRADFIAELEDDVLVIEVKASIDQLKQGHRQADKYRAAYNPFSKIAIALPVDEISDRVKRYCDKHNIMLIDIDTKNSDIQMSAESTSPKNGFEYNHIRELIHQGMIGDWIRCHPNEVVKYILDYHEKNGTTPVYDLVEIWRLTTRINEYFDRENGEENSQTLDDAFTSLLDKIIDNYDEDGNGDLTRWALAIINKRKRESVLNDLYKWVENNGK